MERFEMKFAEYVGVKHAIAVCNGTAALHTALVALEVGPGDEVIVPSFTFIATSNSVLYQRAKPVFVDIDPHTYNVDVNEIEKKVTKKTKAIIPVHYAGQPADMDPINEVAEKYGLSVIEDSAEAHGSLYKGKKAGSLGSLACFSFYPNKGMTTGEGGMITTNDEEVAEKVRMIRSHGQDRRYHHVILGYNYRMTDFQAALGLVQLKRLDWVNSKKVKAARRYNNLFIEIGEDKIITPYVAPNVTHTYMFYSIRFKNNEMRNFIMRALEESLVETRIAFPPVHLQPLYRSLLKYKESFLPVTEEVADTILSLPIYPHITRNDQNYIVSIIERCLVN